MSCLVSPHCPTDAVIVIVVNGILIASRAIAHIIPFADVIRDVPGFVVVEIRHLIVRASLDPGRVRRIPLVFVHGIENVGPAIHGRVGQHVPIPVTEGPLNND